LTQQAHAPCTKGVQKYLRTSTRPRVGSGYPRTHASGIRRLKTT